MPVNAVADIVSFARGSSADRHAHLVDDVLQLNTTHGVSLGPNLADATWQPARNLGATWVQP
jgi:hypothetical protein